MGLRVRTNINSLRAQRSVNRTTHKLGKFSEKMASGYRINRSADDAAGLAISETFRGDIRSQAQARRNASDAVSMIQTAEGGLEEMQSAMIRLRELAIQSASDTIGNAERGYLNKEFYALKDEIDRIAVATEFNGTRLLTGQKELSEELSVDHMPSPLEVQVDKDYFTDADSSEMSNPINIIRLDFGKLNATIEGEGSLELGRSTQNDGVQVSLKNEAQQAIAKVDSAMNRVSDFRADLGALQNRFESTIRNLSTSHSNKSAANSRIKDADYAHITAEYTLGTILQQSGISVLAQANSAPEVALQLIQGV